MACLPLKCFAILLFLSIIHARPGGLAHHGQQDKVIPSEPSDTWTAPYESPNYGPGPTAIYPADAQISSTPIGSNAYRQSTWGSAIHSSQQPSYPLHYNSSATSGPTAAYGISGPSRFMSGNFSRPHRTAGPLDATCNCAPPLTVTTEKTVSAPPLTVTMTSIITSNPEPLSQITPTVTITVTSTVCGLNGQITGVASNGSSAVIAEGGEQGSGGETFTGTEGYPEFPSKPASEPAPIVQTSPAVRPMDTQSFPQATGTEAGSEAPAHSHKPSFTNTPASVKPSFPVGTGTSQLPDILPSSIEQPHITGLPDSQAQPQPYLSEIPGSGEAAANATTIPPVAPYPSRGDANENQHNSFQYPGPMTNTQNGGQGAESTQAAPIPSSVMPYGSGSAVPINKITSQQGIVNVPPVSPAAPPYGLTNSASVERAWTTRPSTQANPKHPTTSIRPPFVNATTPQPSVPNSGTGAPYQPTTSTAPASTSSPAPLQTPMYPVAPDDATTLAVNNSVPDAGSTSTSQMPPSLSPVHATVTQEVIPMPLTTAGNINSIKLYGNSYGDENAKPTGANWETLQGTTMPGPSMGGSTSLNKDEDTTLVSAPMTTSSETGLPVPIPTPTSPPTMPPPPQSSIPAISLPTSPSNPTPISSSAPPPPPLPPPSTTTSPPNPSCPPPNNPITADFNTFKRTKPPLPTPYLSLNYTGFALSNGSPTPHLTSPASAPRKSISIAPGSSFNLSSIALACAAPPCNITMWGQSVPGAARALLTNRIVVEAASEGVQPYTVVDGLAQKGWVRLESVSFRVGDGDGGGEMAVDNVVYTVEGGGGECG
ncbi:MAG: hypothetical protein Q9184_003108 [Pyrenodesmia sp. 2 TL-2023]